MKISSFYQSRNPWVDKVSPKITMLGDWGIDCGIAGLFFLGGVALKDRKARDTGLMALETLLHTGLLVQVVKHLAGRQRPWVESGIDYWYGPPALFSSATARVLFPAMILFLPGTPFPPGDWPR